MSWDEKGSDVFPRPFHITETIAHSGDFEQLIVPFL
jgi:hypothetical protein